MSHFFSQGPPVNCIDGSLRMQILGAANSDGDDGLIELYKSPRRPQELSCSGLWITLSEPLHQAKQYLLAVKNIL